MEGDPVEVVNYRVTAVGLKDKPELNGLPDTDAGPLAKKDQREVYFGAGCLPTPVYERRQMAAGIPLQGPAVIEQLGSTTILQPGQVARADRFGNLIMTLVRDEEAA